MHGQNTVEPGGKVKVRIASTQPFVTFKGTVQFQTAECNFIIHKRRAVFTGFLLEAVDPLSSIQRTVGNFAYPTTNSARILSCSDDANQLGGDDGHQQQVTIIRRTFKQQQIKFLAKPKTRAA